MPYPIRLEVTGTDSPNVSLHAPLSDRFPVSVKRPYGAPERYLVIPASAPRSCEKRSLSRYTRQRLPLILEA